MVLFAEQSLQNIITIAIAFGILIFGVVIFAVFARYFRLWIQSVTTVRGSVFSTFWE